MSRTAIVLRVLLAILLLAVASTAAAAKPHRKGETITVSGRVIDGDGEPLAGVPVLLEVSREAFRLRHLRRETRPPVRIAGRTDERGAFSLEWIWDGYHNRFALLVALQEEGDALEVFARHDLSTEILGGQGAVTTVLTVPDASLLRWAARLEAGRLSDDERRVYARMGRPERVDVSRRDEVTDSSWWYFARGKVFRFFDGTLAEEMDFEPVEPIE